MELNDSPTRLPRVEWPGSLADFARRAIERAILAGEYRAGERLVDSRRLGLSSIVLGGVFGSKA
jgi:DNA-binding GntR family transcriptional regulator